MVTLGGAETIEEADALELPVPQLHTVGRGSVRGRCGATVFKSRLLPLEAVRETGKFSHATNAY